MSENRVMKVIYTDCDGTSRENSLEKAMFIIAGPEKAWINRGKIISILNTSNGKIN
jgi:hypothetical protein